MINIFGQGLCHFHLLWAFSLRHHQMVRIGAGHGLPVAIDEIEVSFGSKDAPVLDRAEPGDPSEANKDRNQRLSSSAFANPYFRALRTPFLEAVLHVARAICFGTSLLAAPPPGWRRDMQLAISGRSGLVGWRTSLIWRAHF